MIDYIYGNTRGTANVWGAHLFEEYVFEGTLENGVERFDDYVEALVDRLLLREHTADVGYLGANDGVRDDRRRFWVG